MSEVDVKLLIRAAKTPRDRLMLAVAYYGALRVSELVSLRWGQLIARESGEMQLEVVGKRARYYYWRPSLPKFKVQEDVTGKASFPMSLGPGAGAPRCKQHADL